MTLKDLRRKRLKRTDAQILEHRRRGLRRKRQRENELRNLREKEARENKSLDKQAVVCYD